MKKLSIVIAFLALALIAVGLWWMIRRTPSTVLPGEENRTVFQTAHAGQGILMHHEDPQTPLRTLRWLQPQTSDLVLAQVVTQSDRQQLALFKHGTFQDSYLVPRPENVREGFFRLAELRDAHVVEGDVAVLLYAAPGGGGDEPALVLALDLKTKEIRWIHRAPGERLAPGDVQSGVVYLLGAKTPPVRLSLARASNERLSAAGARSSARTIELTPEILEISDLKPTGAWTFLLAHRGGLSAYMGSSGWLHHPLPGNNPGWFKDVQGVLAGGPKTYWWQPFPGMVVQVLANGSPAATWTPQELITADPSSKDASLLHLRGTDGGGNLWFDLAIPTNTAMVSQPASAAPPSDSSWNLELSTHESATVTYRLEDWPTYIKQGMDRIYCWDPKTGKLQRFKWQALEVPQGFSIPSNGFRLLPASGALLLENGPSVWLVPFSSLKLGEPTKTGQPIQPK